MGFRIGDIIELNSNILFYEKVLLCLVVETGDGNYGWVRILNAKKEGLIGKTRYADLTLFKLVRRGGLHV